MKINGETHYLWRTVDHEGEVLESCVTKRRDKLAALRFLKKAMKRYGTPRAILRCRDETHWKCRPPGGRSPSQQSGREQPSTVSATGASDAEVQADVQPAEIRFDPRLVPQPLQPRPPHQPSPGFQSTTRRSSTRMARASGRIGWGTLSDAADGFALDRQCPARRSVLGQYYTKR